jgi:hypothetical protein
LDEVFLPLQVTCNGLTTGFVFQEDFLTPPVDDTAGFFVGVMSNAASWLVSD